MLNRFSRLLKGTTDYLDLLNELSSIYKLDEFYIVIKHDDYNYKIKSIYNEGLNKLKYPKKFRKTIYDAEPESISYTIDENLGEIPIDCGQREFYDCVCYKVRFVNNHKTITITQTSNNFNKILNKLDNLKIVNSYNKWHLTGSLENNNYEAMMFSI